jgi:hypothetical protein
VVIIILYKTCRLADDTAEFSSFLKQDSLDMSFSLLCQVSLISIKIIPLNFNLIVFMRYFSYCSSEFRSCECKIF